MPNDPDGPADDNGELSRRDEVPMVAARPRGEWPGARMVAERVRMGRDGEGVSGGVSGPLAVLDEEGEDVSDREGVDCRARLVVGLETGVGGAMDDRAGGVEVEVEGDAEGFSDSADWRVRLPTGAMIACKYWLMRRSDALLFGYTGYDNVDSRLDYKTRHVVKVPWRRVRATKFRVVYQRSIRHEVMFKDL